MGFKGSGGIAAAADLAIELVSGEESITELRKKMNEGTPVLIKWHIKKNRHGRVGTIMMEFTGKYGIFAEYDENNF
jgi:replicative DNA helicase